MAEHGDTKARCTFDHLILGTPSLDIGLAWCRERTEAALTPGGAHPGRGTCNALLPLAHRSYLELLAPDPAQRDYSEARAVLEGLSEPAFTWWCLRTHDLAGVRRDLVDAGVPCGPIVDIGRKVPGGHFLGWRLFFTLDESLGASLPFFIDWGGAPHPSTVTSPAGYLKSLSLASARGDALRHLFDVIGYADNRVCIADAAVASLTATLMLGELELVVQSPEGCALPPLR